MSTNCSLCPCRLSPSQKAGKDKKSVIGDGANNISSIHVMQSQVNKVVNDVWVLILSILLQTEYAKPIRIYLKSAKNLDNLLGTRCALKGGGGMSEY